MLKNRVIAIILTFLMIFLTACTQTKDTPYSNCRNLIKTYGDAIECVIELDNLQRQM